MRELCVRGRRREAGGADGSAQPKARFPHQNVRKKGKIWETLGPEMG